MSTCPGHALKRFANMCRRPSCSTMAPGLMYRWSMPVSARVTTGSVGVNSNARDGGIGEADAVAAAPSEARGTQRTSQGCRSAVPLRTPRRQGGQQAQAPRYARSRRPIIGNCAPDGVRGDRTEP